MNAVPRLAPDRVSPVMLPWIAAWFGAISGLAEASVMSLRQLIQRPPHTGFGWDLAWMAPLSALAAFLLVGLLILAAVGLVRAFGRRSERSPGVPVKPTVVLLGFLACFGVLESKHLGMHQGAAVLLSTGI